MADEDTFDVHGYMKERFGATIKASNEDGTHTIVRDGNEEVVDVKGLVASEFAKVGRNMDGIAMQFSTRENPMETNALDFSTQMGFSVAQTAKDKIRILREEYGTENVVFDSKNKSFNVRDADGNWKRAESGFLNNLLANEGAAIGGSIAGAKIGLVGGLPGAIIGGAIGGAVGKMTTLLDADRAGIRTDLEAADVMKEMGKEFIIGLAGGAVVPVGKAAMRAVGSAMSLIGRKTATNEAAQMGVAKALSQVTGTSIDDNARYLAKPDFFNKVHKEIATHEDLLQAVRNQKPGAPKIEPVLSVKTRMAKEIDSLMLSGKDKMFKDFDQFINRGDVKKALRTTKIDANPWVDGFKRDMIEAGAIDEAGRIITTNTSQKSLTRKVLQEIDNIGGAQKLSSMSLEQANKLKQNLQNMVKFSGNELEIGKAFQGMVKRNSGRLREQMTEALPTQTMRDEWVKVHQNWGQAKDFFDTHKRLFKPGEVESRLGSFLGDTPSGEAVRGRLNAAFSGIFELPGASERIQRLVDTQSAINTFNLFRKGSTGIPSVGGAAAAGGFLGGLPGAATAATVGGVVTSPRLAPAIANRILNSRLTQGTLDAMRTVGKVGQFVHSLSKSQRAALLTTQGIQALDNIFEGAARDRAVIGEQLKQQMSGVSGGR